MTKIQNLKTLIKADLCPSLQYLFGSLSIGIWDLFVI